MCDSCLKDAEQQVNVSAADLLNGSVPAGQNMVTLEYFDWLDALREKYIDHLTDHIESYAVLMKRLGVLVGKNDRATLREMMGQVCTQVIRQSTDDDGNVSKFLPFKQKVYYRNNDGQNRTPEIRCELLKHGLNGKAEHAGRDVV